MIIKNEEINFQKKKRLIEHLFWSLDHAIMRPALKVAAELNIADWLKDDKKTISYLAKKTNTHPDALYRLLRFLSNDGIFFEVHDNVFSQSDISYFLRSDVPFSMRNYILNKQDQPDWIIKSWNNLLYTIKTNKSAFSSTHKESTLWEYFSRNKEDGNKFSKSMTLISNIYAERIFSTYDFSKKNTIADIGGAYGSLLSIILEKNSNLKGILFDLPDVIEKAKIKITNKKIKKQLKFVSGDFFEFLPNNIDIYLIRYILHDWDDESCIKILKNCKKYSPNAKVLIVERIISESNNSQQALALDLSMMMLFDNAKERTLSEYKNLLELSGYRIKKKHRN